MKKRRLLFAQITVENAAVCVNKVGHANTLSMKKINEKKKLKKPKRITADVSDSIHVLQEFGIVIPIASHT